MRPLARQMRLQLREVDPLEALRRGEPLLVRLRQVVVPQLDVLVRAPGDVLDRALSRGVCVAAA